MLHILAATSTSSKGNPYLFPIIILALFGLLYFVMIRPQRNRQRQAQQMQSQVMPGQRVRTTAGMYATVISVEDQDVVLEVAPGVQVRFLRRAIMDVVPGFTGTEAEDPEPEDSETFDEAEDDAAKGGTGSTADATEDGSTTT